MVGDKHTYVSTHWMVRMMVDQTNNPHRCCTNYSDQRQDTVLGKWDSFTNPFFQLLCPQFLFISPSSSYLVTIFWEENSWWKETHLVLSARLLHLYYQKNTEKYFDVKKRNFIWEPVRWSEEWRPGRWTSWRTASTHRSASHSPSGAVSRWSR